MTDFKHRESIENIIMQIANAMHEKCYINSDSKGLNIKFHERSVNWELVVNYEPVDGGWDYINVPMSMTVWGKISYKVTPPTPEVTETLKNFAGIVKDSYLIEKEAHKLSQEFSKSIAKLWCSVAVKLALIVI